MSTSLNPATQSYEFTIDEVEYLRHGDKAFLARVFTPVGSGPFRSVVQVHGGAWNLFDRGRDQVVNEAMARSGFVVVALDFRQGEEGAYPRSVADVNYGIRWVKANAEKLGTRADLVGLSGTSTGGHLAMLNAMCPADPRFAQIELPDGDDTIDASVHCIVLLWPILNPLSRYRYAKRRLGGDNPADWAQDMIEYHHRYWGTEAAMAEGNPMLILESGEPVGTPPALFIEASRDDIHNYCDIDGNFDILESERFVANYRRAGGSIDLLTYDAPHNFATQQAPSAESADAVNQVIAFLDREIPNLA